MWRAIVPKEQAFFDKAARTIWSEYKIHDYDPQSGVPPPSSDLLSYFHGLAQSLISDTTSSMPSANHISHHTEDEDSGPNSDFQKPFIYSQPEEQQESIGQTIPPIYLASWTNLSIKVLLLISTAFFRFVIAFLLCKPVR